MAGTKRAKTCRDAGEHIPVMERDYRDERAVWCEGCWEWVFVEPLRNHFARSDAPPAQILSSRHGVR